MKTKKDVNTRVKELKELLKNNSKDAHYTEKLLTELLRLKREDSIIALDCGKPVKGKVFKGETFEIILTTKGALYHTYGGYNIFIEQGKTTLYEALSSLSQLNELMKDMKETEIENLKLYLTSLGFVLNCPFYSISNDDLFYSVADTLIKGLQKLVSAAENAELQPETVVEDSLFKDALLSIEEMKNNNKK